MPPQKGKSNARIVNKINEINIDNSVDITICELKFSEPKKK